tara:strand:+ start:1526 stop:1951 length:426 start_codon:yes stop_codon:yes gene_type:complete
VAEDEQLNAVEKGIFAALNTGAITGTVAAAQHYNVVAPPDATFPLIVVQLLDSGREGDSFSQRSQFGEYAIKCITKGEHSVAAAGTMQNAIDTVMEGASLTVTGLTAFASRWQRWVSFMEYSQDRQAYVHRGGVYRINLTP